MAPTGADGRRGRGRCLAGVAGRSRARPGGRRRATVATQTDHDEHSVSDRMRDGHDEPALRRRCRPGSGTAGIGSSRACFLSPVRTGSGSAGQWPWPHSQRVVALPGGDLRLSGQVYTRAGDMAAQPVDDVGDDLRSLGLVEALVAEAGIDPPGHTRQPAERLARPRRDQPVVGPVVDPGRDREAASERPDPHLGREPTSTGARGDAGEALGIGSSTPPPTGRATASRRPRRWPRASSARAGQDRHEPMLPAGQRHPRGPATRAPEIRRRTAART